jgi:hypothetical protein
MKLTIARNADVLPGDWHLKKIRQQLKPGCVVGIASHGLALREFLVEAVSEEHLSITYLDERAADLRARPIATLCIPWCSIQELQIV